MPMAGPLMATTMQSILLGYGNLGISTPLLCNAVGNGSILSIVGKTFTTTDTGTGNGAGAGLGTGITGVVSSVISEGIQAAFLQRFGMIGKTTIQIANAVAQALEEQLALATFTSVHSPVYVGIGVVTPGSILVNSSEWASNIQNLAPGFLGKTWPGLCQAIATGCVQAFATATGQVVIAGAGPPPPNPYSGPNQVQPAGVVS